MLNQMRQKEQNRNIKPKKSIDPLGSYPDIYSKKGRFVKIDLVHCTMANTCVLLAGPMWETGHAQIRERQAPAHNANVQSGILGQTNEQVVTIL
jgi:hypothetical protein